MKTCIMTILVIFAAAWARPALAISPAQKIDLSVTEKGFEPKSVNVTPDTDVVLNVTRKTETTCATKIQIPSLKIVKDLPLNQSVLIALGRLKKGEIRFGCQENLMESGVISVR